MPKEKKLTDDQARLIRALHWASGEMRAKVVAGRMGVSVGLVGDIVQGSRYVEVEDEDTGKKVERVWNYLYGIKDGKQGGS